MKNLKNTLEKSSENIREFLKENKSFIYVFTIFLIIIGYGFFFNSNAILRDSNSIDFTTALFESKQIGVNNVELRARKYSPISNIVEFYIYTDNGDSMIDYTLDFELRERRDATQTIDVDIRRLDKNNYIVRAKVPKKWTVLSLAVTNFDPSKIEIEGEETNNISMNNWIKFYSEYDDMEHINNLKEKKSNEYLADGVDLEIQSIKNKIVNTNKIISEKNKSIEAYKENLIRLNEDKVYQTESEKQNTDNRINSIESTINSENEEVKKLIKEVKEYKEKISKLEEKKKELMSK